MADDKTFTQADIDAALAKHNTSVQESIDKLEAKNAELIADLRKARKAGEIKPEDLTAAEERADKALADLSEATKQLKTLTTERDKAVTALEAEQGAARNYALEAELAGAIAEGNVLPQLVPAFKAMMEKQAKAELVDGKYAVTIGDKPARDAIKAVLESDDGKAFRAAPINGGGGAGGSRGADGDSGRTISKTDYDATIQSNDVKAIGAMNEGIRKGEVKVVDQAA